MVGVAAAGVGVSEFGRTVTSGRPRVTFALTTVEPAKTACVAVPSASSVSTSVSRPLSSLTATRAAISLPSCVEPSSTAAGATSPMSFARMAAFGATRKPSTSAPSAT